MNTLRTVHAQNRRAVCISPSCSSPAISRTPRGSLGAPEGCAPLKPGTYLRLSCLAAMPASRGLLVKEKMVDREEGVL